MLLFSENSLVSYIELSLYILTVPDVLAGVVHSIPECAHLRNRRHRECVVELLCEACDIRTVDLCVDRRHSTGDLETKLLHFRCHKERSEVHCFFREIGICRNEHCACAAEW